MFLGVPAIPVWSTACPLSYSGLNGLPSLISSWSYDLMRSMTPARPQSVRTLLPVLAIEHCHFHNHETTSLDCAIHSARIMMSSIGTVKRRYRPAIT